MNLRLASREIPPALESLARDRSLCCSAAAEGAAAAAGRPHSSGCSGYGIGCEVQELPPPSCTPVEAAVTRPGSPATLFCGGGRGFRAPATAVPRRPGRPPSARSLDLAS
eukprot:3368865-Prymnesium_polylepis.1